MKIMSFPEANDDNAILIDREVMMLPGQSCRSLHSDNRLAAIDFMQTDAVFDVTQQHIGDCDFARKYA